jgi:hypothetical protein
MSTCGVCNRACVSEAANDPIVKCAGVCEKVFHARCIKDDADGKKTRSTWKDWKCKDCRINASVSSGNSSSTVLTKDFLVSVMEDLKKQVFDELKVFQNQYSQLSTSMQFVSDKMDDSNKLMSEIRSELAEVKKENEKLRVDNVTLTNEMHALRDRVRSLEQYTRKNNLEISGIPSTPREDVAAIIRDVGAALGLEVAEGQISAAHRIPSFKKDRPQSIVVQFTARSTKEAWLTKYKDLKGLTANQVNAAFPPQKVYVNEHLSPENKVFLAKLKTKCRDLGYTYVWSRDGKFFVRKAAGDKCKKINGYDELNSLK